MKPVIRIWCLPQMTEKQLKDFFDKIVVAAVSVNGMGLKSEQDLICLFPKDMMSYGLGSEIVVEVVGRQEHPLLSQQPLEELIYTLKHAVSAMFPKAYVQGIVRGVII